MALTTVSNTGIADGAVGAAEIAAGAIAAVGIDDGSITAKKIAAGGLTSNTLNVTNLQAGNVVFDHIATTFSAAPTFSSTSNFTGQATFAGASQHNGPSRGRFVTLGHIKAEGAVTSNTVTLNLANGNFFSWTTNAAVTVANPTNANTGQCGSLIVTSNGSYTVSFAENWRFPAGTAPTLSATAGLTDRIDYIVVAANAVHAVATLNLDDKA